MKKFIPILFLGIILSSIIYVSCKKEVAKVIPAIKALAVTNITANSATSGGEVTADGGAPVTARGMCWSLNQNPTTVDTKTSNGSGIGSFTSSITDLTPGTTYYIKAYAINSVGTSYSSQSTFTTLALAPVLTTTDLTAVTSTSANSGGNISNDGGSPVTARGVCWTTTQNPTIADSKTTDGTGTGEFTSSITGLTPGSTYYIRAYATNSIGTSYGNQISTTTTAILPTVATTPVTAIASTTATSGGNITDDGGAAITARGVCWSITQNPTIADNKTTDGTGTGVYTSSMTDLTPGATYYIRAYATNSIGTAYGNQITITTLAILPTITTTAVTAITSATATSGGNITNDGGASVTSRGVCWNTSQNPTTADNKTSNSTGTGVFTSSLTGLTPGTTYYVRAYATNSIGTSYGSQATFTTLSVLPVLVTTDVSSITSTTASSGGNIISDGGAPVTSRGVCWSTSSSPIITDSKTINGNGTGSFTSNLSGLTANTLYYVRAYATNSQGTAYGNQLSFLSTVGVTGTFTDSRDGKIYKTVKIGSQTWMAENLAYLPAVSPSSNGSETAPYYYVYGYEGTSVSSAKATANFATYGVLYNWPAAKTACPNGWHLPSDAEWTTLTTYLGGESVAGGKLKETGTSHWLSPNTGATNSSGFTALPGGGRNGYGGFYVIGSQGHWWSSTEYYTYYAWSRTIYNGNEGVSLYYNYEGNGFSVRCIKSEGQTSTLPTVTTSSISNIDQTTATGGGNVTSDGGASVTAKGICWSTSSSPTIADSKTIDGNGLGTFSSNITGLSGNVQYYVRAYATNNQGTAYGNQVTFTTEQALSQPTVTTTSITSITQTTAIGGGNVMTDGGAPVTSRGVCWSTSTSPTTANSKTTDGTGTGTYTSSITGLVPGTTYYIRAYATNSQGTTYGVQVTFTALLGGGTGNVTDVEGNVYQTVTIGTQVWMVENLKTTKYQDNTSIPLVTDNAAWSNLITPGYSWYNNDAVNKATYGALYNWYTVNTGNLCPTGWHVPTNTEWTTLTSYLGGTSIAGGKLKETGTSHWLSPNTGATNETGFSAVPGGDRNDLTGRFYNIGFGGNWWSSSETGTEYAWSRGMGYYDSDVYVSSYRKQSGLSVRCIKGDNYPQQIPVLTTTTPTIISAGSVQSGGNITSDGGAVVTSRGVCWSTSQNPTTENSKTTNGTGTGIFTSTITGLTVGATYYIRAYATNSIGTAYGNQISTTITAIIPTITTTSLTAITSTTATSGGNITDDGGAAVTARGVCWNTSQNPTIADSKTTDGTGTGIFTSSITGLTPGATYYIRAYATNSIGTAYGNQMSTTIAAIIPTITTINVTDITSTTASSGGNITSDGGAPVTVRGVCWSTNQNPTTADSKTSDGTGTGIFTSSLTGLIVGTTYNLRAYATNLVGTVYGNVISFHIQISEIIFNPNITYGTVTDTVGNVYKTIIIGTQTWMAENLRTTRYKNNLSIPLVTDHITWSNKTNSAYCWFNNDAATYKSTYGALYNWYTVNTGDLCPTGWHVPTDDEWTTLTTYLGGISVAGGKLKETGTSHWLSPNTGATNETGFSAVPGGYRGDTGLFFYSGREGGFWWSSTTSNTSAAWYRIMYFGGYNVGRNYDSKKDGASVRCIKD
ncbi:MAG: hypothetical protein KKG99_14500 [Bacteroidetes bacterium]|nr:hypothetical protein [Bacteroidota bacterium]